MNAAKPSDKNHNVYFVPGLHRGLRLLELLARSNETMTVSELAQRLELSRSSAFRLVYTLQYLGFLTTSDDRTFQLGARVLNLGFSFLAKQDILQVARRDLEELRDLCGISTHLAIRDGLDILFLDCIQTRTGFLSNVNVGARLPAYASPMGWVMLSELPNRELIALHKEIPFEPFTEGTPSGIAELMQLVAKSSADGYVLSHGVVEQGGASVTAPIFDRSGNIVAAIDISGPQSAFDQDKLDSFYIPAVRDAAGKISRRLGNAGN
ncbi:IclR family transcriptional regulator [Pseudomonas azerbaijanoccidentalis]|jgi:DNA-binding IclR family transcriptional regulator